MGPALGLVLLFALQKVEPAEVRFRPAPGTKLAYALAMRVEEGAGRVEVRGRVERRALASGGRYRVEEVLSDVVTVVDGQELAVPDRDLTTYTVSPTGEVVDASAGRNREQRLRLARMLMVVFPEGRALAKGTTWEFRAEGRAGAPPLAATYEVADLERWKATAVVRIEAEVRETGGRHPMRGRVTSWVRQADGWPVRSEARIEDFPLAPDRRVRLERSLTLSDPEAVGP